MTSRTTNNVPPLVAALCLCTSFACGPQGPDELSQPEFTESEEAIINGTIDYGDANRNAAVWVQGCTGGLVAPDMVLTAGHCLGGVGASDWTEDALVGTGTWRVIQQDITIRVGPNSASPVFSTTARWANFPGYDDVVLLLLTTPVPSSIARPAKIMNEAEYNRLGGLSGKIMYNPGYGSECSPGGPRRYAYVTDAGGNPRGVNTFRGLIRNWGGPQALFEQGDSGSPLLWWNGSEARLYLVGVGLGYSPLQGGICSDTGRINPHYVGTFKTGAGDPSKPNISAWLTAEVTQTLRRSSFKPGSYPDKWHDWFCVGNEACRVGDFDGDGRDDIATFTLGSSGDVYVGRSYGFRTGGGSSFPQAGRGFESGRWHSSFGYGNEQVGVLDIDGDGRDDIFAGTPSRLWITRSTGAAFGTSYVATYSSMCAPGTRTCITGEIRRDSAGEDILSINQSTGALTVYRSTGTALALDSGFNTGNVSGVCTAPRTCELSDYDNDGDADLIIMHNDNNGHVDIATNTGSQFGVPYRWVNGACYDVWGFKRTCFMGDVDGDSRPDLIAQDEYFGEIHVVRNGSTTTELRWHGNLCDAGHYCASGDFNGDGLADVVDFAKSVSSGTQGDVFVQTSIATF